VNGYAQLCTPQRDHLFRGVRPGVPHLHVCARGPAVRHRHLEPPLRARQPYHRVRRQHRGDRAGSAQRRRPVPCAHRRTGRLAHLRIRSHCAARPPEDRPVPPVRAMHRWALHPEPAEGPAPAHRMRRDCTAHTASYYLSTLIKVSISIEPQQETGGSNLLNDRIAPGCSYPVAGPPVHVADAALCGEGGKLVAAATAGMSAKVIRSGGPRRDLAGRLCVPGTGRKRSPRSRRPQRRGQQHRVRSGSAIRRWKK
jgi:hypothetical protein